VPPNALLIFSDAAWNSTTCDSGLGWVATDINGAAVSLGYKDAVCLSDSRCLVGLLTGNSSVISIQGLLHNICALSSSLNFISFKFISRAYNSAADCSAKNVLFVLFNSPSGMRNSLADNV
ncbi:hypothetical protein F2Q70_00033249, partial [Brassica cretica]